MDEVERLRKEVAQLKAAMKELDRNLSITEEKVKHFLDGQTMHAAHIWVMNGVLMQLLGEVGIDFKMLKGTLDQIPKELAGPARSILKTFETVSRRPNKR